MRDFVAGDQLEYGRLLRPIWQSESEAFLQALAQSPLRATRPEQFATLFGYVLGNRDGIDNWHQIPARRRRSVGRRIAPVRSGSGGDRKEHRSADRAPL